MAQYVDTLTHGVVERFLAGAAGFKEKMAARYEHYRVYTNSVAELRRLTDRDLNDLGLNRSMIKSVALEAADKRARK